MNIIDSLMKIGFTKHESILYTTLCKEGELTGYEAAKISGIPRSNAYLALAGLVEKGGAYRIDSDVVKYLAVPVEELVANSRRQFSNVLENIAINIPRREAAADPYITITGKTHIVDKIKNMIQNAQYRIYLSCSHNELEYVKSEIIEARNRGLKVVIITSPPFEMDNAIIYYNEKQPGLIHLIVDSLHVLTGEILDTGDCTCLYSKNKNLVQLLKDSLTYEIKLVQIQKQMKP